MPSTTIHFTPAFLKACEGIWLDGFNKGINGEDQHPDFKSFFSSLIDKSENSLEEKAALPFNPQKCEARTEQYGYAIQCTRAKIGDGCLCGTHQKMLDKYGVIRYGRFNETLPDTNLITGASIKWGPKKNKAGKSPKNNNNTSKMKVADMVDYLTSRIPVDDFRGLRKNALTELYLKVKEKENASSTDEENSPVSQVEHSEIPDQSAQDDNNVNDSQIDTHQEVEDDGTGVGLHLSPQPPKTVSEYKTLFDELGIDYSSIKGMRAFKLAHQDYIKSKEEEEQTQPMSDDDDELHEDKSSYQEMDFEGVSYLEEEDSGKIYNLKHQHVGQWNEDVDDIIWKSDEFKQTHESSRQ